VNDNRPSREDVQVAILTTTTLISEHLTKGLPKMLEANGTPKRVVDAVQAFVEPVLERLRTTEATVLAYTSEPPKNRFHDLLSPKPDLVVETFARVVDRMREFAEGFVQAATPEQVAGARKFQQWVEQVSEAWQPDKAKDRGDDFEME
jgi:hypothetical protein